MTRYYIAYGSNLNLSQMGRRCPGSTVMGTVTLKDRELSFKGSKSGSYLTIDKKPGGKVPVVVFAVTEADERALDLYEGFPIFYHKEDFRVTYKGILTGKRRTVKAFAYVMRDDAKIGLPTEHYVNVCLEGYDSFGFDEKYLLDAYEKSWEEACVNEG